MAAKFRMTLASASVRARKEKIAKTEKINVINEIKAIL